jgi:hypothetical protein
VWAGLLVLSGLGVAGHFIWQRHRSTAALHPQYQLSPEAVHITPPPPWIRSDVKLEALRDAGLVGNLSLLEEWDSLVGRIRQAFEFHPWVASVGGVRRGLPGRLEIDVEYRRPIAAVESTGPEGAAVLPIDVHGIRLPDADLTDIERQYLPRITGVTGRPSIGDAWLDPRVLGGARLAAELTDIWHQLRLTDIVPSTHPDVRGDDRYYSFQIISRGGTRIVWGAAPGEELRAGESPAPAKRERLLEYATKQGRLDELDGPEAVDVRNELLVVPRTARGQADAGKPADIR